jgi:hypothetical protein
MATLTSTRPSASIVPTNSPIRPAETQQGAQVAEIAGCLPVVPGQLPTPPAQPTLLFTLANGRHVQLSLDAGIQAELPEGWGLRLSFEPRPLAPYGSVATALDGANARQAGDPFHLGVVVIDCATGASLTLPEPLLGYAVRLSLPVLSETAAPATSDTQFAWLRALWNADTFAGYLRIDTPYDAGSDSLVFSATLADVQSAHFLPVLVAPVYVQNVDPNLHIWSGPNADVGVGPDADIGSVTTNEAVDFGLAATHQFTTFQVVGPQVEARLFVVNTETGDYGWIDVAGVGPAGPPV